MLISTTDAQGLFTKTLVDVYKQRIHPTSFLRSFFPTVESATLEVSVEVRRGFELIAEDVTRGTDGNRNEFTKSTEKIFIPPYFREWFDATQLQLYDRLYGATEVNDSLFLQYINDVADSQMELQEKIERSYELQCAQVLETGIVTLKSGPSIDFKRKAASKIDLGGGNYFANTDVDPFKVLTNGCVFLRQVGKAAGNKFNAICGSDALDDLLNNNVFLKRQNLFNMALDMVRPPILNSIGATYHGTLTCGAYKVDLWAYPQTYQDVTTKTNTYYINSKKITLIPDNPKFKLAFGAVPQLITPNSPAVKGAFVFGELEDKWNAAKKMDIKSAGLAIPTAVDTIYTVQVKG